MIKKILLSIFVFISFFNTAFAIDLLIYNNLIKSNKEISLYSHDHKTKWPHQIPVSQQGYAHIKKSSDFFVQVLNPGTSPSYICECDAKSCSTTPKYKKLYQCVFKNVSDKERRIDVVDVK